MPHTGIDASCMDAYEHVVIPDHRLVDVPEFQDVGRAVGVLDDCFHRTVLICRTSVGT